MCKESGVDLLSAIEREGVLLGCAQPYGQESPGGDRGRNPQIPPATGTIAVQRKLPAWARSARPNRSIAYLSFARKFVRRGIVQSLQLATRHKLDRPLTTTMRS